MSLTINGITINRIVTTPRSTTNSAGRIESSLRINGVLTGYSTFALAADAARQLEEMVWYGRHAGGLYVDSSENSVLDGMYELSEFTSEHEPVSSQTRLITVNLTLTRIGGGGVAGANVDQLVYGRGSLQTNGFSITSTPVMVAPVGSTIMTAVPSARTSGDGTVPYRQTSDPIEYLLSGADYNRAEVKVWDTGGSLDPATWVRVWAPDHTFAAATNCAIENELIRIVPSLTDGSGHVYEVWDATASAYVTVTSTSSGDGVSLGAGGTATLRGCRINELSPWRVSVTWFYSYSVSPFRFEKTVVVTRGHYLAKVTLEAISSVVLRLGLAGSGMTYFASRAAGAIHAVESGSVTLGDGGQNWIVGFNTTNDVLALGAVTSTSTSFIKSSSSGLSFGVTATSLTAYLGGISYETSKAFGQAEDGTLAGGADTTGTISGSSGTVVRLDALNEQVNFSHLSNPPAGSRVVALIRVAASVAGGSANAGDTLKLAIRNVTAGSDGTTATIAMTDTTVFPAADTFTWYALEWTSWNGSDTTYPYAVKNASATGQDFYIDAAIFLSTTNSNEGLRPVAMQALTEMTYWPVNTKVVS